jgi:hypothetical protein
MSFRGSVTVSLCGVGAFGIYAVSIDSPKWLLIGTLVSLFFSISVDEICTAIKEHR